MAKFIHIPSGTVVSCDATPNPALYRPVDEKPEAAQKKPAASKRKQVAKGA